MNKSSPTNPSHNAIRRAIDAPATYGLRQWSGWAIGALALISTLVFEAPEGLSPEGWKTAGVAMLMAAFWISESIPIPATALLPLVLLPLLGLDEIKAAAAPYANPLVFLFLGGFLIALAMQKWKLHVRVAIGLIGWMGTRPNHIIASFLLAAALISMWVSNTATALMMLPVATSVLFLIPEESKDTPAMRDFATGLMLAVAYGATSGGMATLIGTPPNALLAGFLNSVYGIQIGFGQWMAIGLPVTLIALPLVYLVLTRIAFQPGKPKIPGMLELIANEKRKLAAFGRGEIIVAIVFGLTALGWIFQPLIASLFPMASDTVIALTGALLLFAIPVDAAKGRFVMDWETAKAVPWDVLILFGGGLSLAAQVQRSGLSDYLGDLSGGMAGVPVLLILAVLCFGILLLTELTSNTATAATFLPVVAAVAVSLGQDPILFLAPTALAANCSYMMPVGTPPNAIVFASGQVHLIDMVRAGWWLNVLLVPVIIGVVWLLGPYVFGFAIGSGR